MRLVIFVDDLTAARLQKIAAEQTRKVEDLAAAAVSEAALEYFRHTPKDDPGVDISLHNSYGP